MGFTTFAGRVLFSTVFFFGVWLKYADEETYLHKVEPVIGFLKSYIMHNGVPVLEFQPRYLLSTTMVVQGLGTPILHDFYNHDISSPEYAEELMHVLKNLSIVGALLLFLGMKNHAAMKSKKKVVKMRTV